MSKCQNQNSPQLQKNRVWICQWRNKIQKLSKHYFQIIQKNLCQILHICTNSCSISKILIWKYPTSEVEVTGWKKFSESCLRSSFIWEKDLFWWRHDSVIISVPDGSCKHLSTSAFGACFGWDQPTFPNFPKLFGIKVIFFSW